MKRSFLENQFKDLELDENTKKRIIDTILDENMNDIGVEKTKTETVRNDLKVKEGLIEELNAKIKEASSVDIEKIKSEQFDLGKAEGSKEFENFKKTSALKEALSGFKAKDVDLLQKMLDVNKIEYEENEGKYTIKGLDDQVKDIKGTHAYLFEDEETPVQTVSLGGEHQSTSTPDLSKMSYEQYKEYRNKNK